MWFITQSFITIYLYNTRTHWSPINPTYTIISHIHWDSTKTHMTWYIYNFFFIKIYKTRQEFYFQILFFFSFLHQWQHKIINIPTDPRSKSIESSSNVIMTSSSSHDQDLSPCLFISPLSCKYQGQITPLEVKKRDKNVGR